MKHFCPQVPVMLVGNKKDLRDDAEMEHLGKKIVTTEEGKAIAEKIGAVAYLECSAKSRDGLKEVFETAAKVALQVCL